MYFSIFTQRPYYLDHHSNSENEPQYFFLSSFTDALCSEARKQQTWLPREPLRKRIVSRGCVVGNAYSTDSKICTKLPDLAFWPNINQIISRATINFHLGEVGKDDSPQIAPVLLPCSIKLLAWLSPIG